MRPLLKAFSSSMHPQSWTPFLLTHSIDLPSHPLYGFSDHFPQVSAVASTELVWQGWRGSTGNMCIGRTSLINRASKGNPWSTLATWGEGGKPLVRTLLSANSGLPTNIQHACHADWYQYYCGDNRINLFGKIHSDCLYSWLSFACSPPPTQYHY